MTTRKIRKMSTVLLAASAKRSSPTAMPTVAVAQIDAAVVRPKRLGDRNTRVRPPSQEGSRGSVMP